MTPQQAYKRKHAAKIRLQMQAWRAANRERIDSYNKQWREQKRAHIADYNRRYKSSHRREVTLKSKEWRHNNHERHMVAQKRRTARWEAKNPGAKAYRSEMRRARLKNATINPVSIKCFFDAVKSKKFFRCYYCRGRFLAAKVHFDHIVALTNGGRHEVGNLCAACPRCNLKKHAKSVSEFKTTDQQMLPI